MKPWRTKKKNRTMALWVVLDAKERLRSEQKGYGVCTFHNKKKAKRKEKS